MLALNELSRELTNAVGELRRVNNPATRSLVIYADSLAADVRERMFELIGKHPEGHPAILALLRKVLEWLEKDRRNASTEEFRDINFCEAYVRDIARFILRQTVMA